MVLGEAGLYTARTEPEVNVTNDEIETVPMVALAVNATVPICEAPTFNTNVIAEDEAVAQVATPDAPAAIVIVLGAVNDASRSLAVFGCP